MFSKNPTRSKFLVGIFRVALPLRFRIALQVLVKRYELFGPKFKIRTIRRVIKTKELEELNFYRIFQPEFQFLKDGVAINAKPPFYSDDRFMEAYRGAIRDELKIVFGKHEDYIIWRAHLLTWFLTQNVPKVGEFVECGVWYGWLSKTICLYSEFWKQDRNFYLVDSWDGESYPNPLSAYAKGQTLFQDVSGRFPYDNVKLIKGKVPTVFQSSDFPKIDQVAYLGLDMNGWEAEVAALEHFYPKLVKGGIIYLDDYGHNYYKQVEMVDDFFKDKREKPLYFPCGSAIYVKQ